MEWLAPWLASRDPSESVKELYREVSRTHQLWNIPVLCLAYRQDCDDFLFSLEDGSGRVAVVHLTFNIETTPSYPSAEVFGSLEEFARQRMLPDHEDWTA